MSVIARCLYRPGGAEARLHVRDVHVAYMIRHRAAIEAGGALLGPDGRTVLGMFLHLRLDPAGATSILDEEPYNRAGLFSQRTLEWFDRFIPHEDPRFLEQLHVAAQDWIAANPAPHR